MTESELTATQKAVLSLFRAYPERSFYMESVVAELSEYDPGNVYFALGVLSGMKLLALTSNRGYDDARFMLAPVEAKCP
jgi:hypothetical protein